MDDGSVEDGGTVYPRRLPSGDQTGPSSDPAPSVTRLRADPSARTTYRSSWMPSPPTKASH
jgi:hypothetical protein